MYARTLPPLRAGLHSYARHVALAVPLLPSSLGRRPFLVPLDLFVGRSNVGRGRGGSLRGRCQQAGDSAGKELSARFSTSSIGQAKWTGQSAPSPRHTSSELRPSNSLVRAHLPTSSLRLLHSHPPMTSPRRTKPRSSRAPTILSQPVSVSYTFALPVAGVDSAPPSDDSGWLLAPVKSELPLPFVSRVGYVLLDVLVVVASTVGVSVVVCVYEWSSPDFAATMHNMEHWVVGVFFLSATLGTFLLLSRGLRWIRHHDRMPPPSASAVAIWHRKFNVRHFLLVVVGGCVATVALDVLTSLSDSPLAVEPLIVQLGLERLPSTIVYVGLVMPVELELFFRGILFAHWARLFGPAAALALSALLFGAMHYSQTSDKVVRASLGGLIFSAVYLASGTLWAPIALHCLNNCAALMLFASISPLRPLDEVEKAIKSTSAVEEMLVQLKRGSVRVHRALGVVSSPSKGEKVSPSQISYEWLTADLTTLSPPASALSSALFTSLDRGSKGYLDVSEFAFAMSLQRSPHTMLTCAVGAVERTVEREGELAVVKLKENVRKAPAARSQVQAPGDAFFTPDQRVAAASLLQSTLSSNSHLTSMLTTPSLLSIDQPTLIPPEDVARSPPSVQEWLAPKSSHPLERGVQRDLIQKYFAVTWTAEMDKKGMISHSSPFSRRCSRQQFDAEISRALLLRPVDGREWISRLTAVLQGEQRHDTQRLFDERLGQRESEGPTAAEK